MGVLIEWRKQEVEHTGSAELNGIVDTPTIYAHPRDNSDPNLEPRTSPAVKWTYNHDDAGETPVVANAFEITVQGNASFEIYRQKRAAWLALAPATRPATFEGQEGAEEVFDFPALATNVQPSGSATYAAWMCMDPHAAQDQQVSLTADVALSAKANGSPGSTYGGGAVDAAASLFNGPLPPDCFRTIKTSATTKVGPSQQGDAHVETFTVTVPAGKYVRIGEVKVGPGYKVLTGSNTFECKSKISFTPHRNLMPDSVHPGCTHIDTGTAPPAAEGGSGN
jgi:hypothetical protein